MTRSRPELVYGVRPVQELLDSRPGEVERLFVARDRRGLGQLIRRARQAGIPVTHLSRDLLARKAGPRAVHQGVAAQVAPLAYSDPGKICRRAAEASPGLLVLLDRVVDPGNLGAVLRSCAAAGADGVLLGGGGTVGLTPAVAKTSAGAVERVPVARVAQPGRLLERLRGEGFTSVALDPRGDRSWDRVDLSGPTVVVLGGEGRGLRPGLLRACDWRVAIPLAKKMDSLNVAVAAGVLLFELVRQRRKVGVGLETAQTR